MYAIVKVGSKQYKVAPGDQIEVNRLEAEEGKVLALDKVLLYENGDDLRVGKPFIDSVKVSAKVEGQSQGEKLIAFKFRCRKGEKKKKGHRQKLTVLQITEIAAV